MAQENCNLDKDEAAILKPSSPSHPTTNNVSYPSSSTSTSSLPPPATNLCLKPLEEFSSQKTDRWENSVEISCKLKAKKESRPSVQFGNPNRCSSCRKRVGLTGFRCRCGDLFCARHRYSDTHGCTFDYKALGREEISKANSLIRAAKIIKI